MRQEPNPDRSSRRSERADITPGVPPGLAEGLERLFQGADPPAHLRAQLQAEAARRFGVPELAAAGPGSESRTGGRFRLLRSAAWASGLAAAAAALFVVLQTPEGGAVPQTKSLAALEPSADARDVDRSGKVDIFDAYLVAHAAAKNNAAAGMPDLDGDGRVTRADADRIARYAVEVAR